VEKLTPRAHMQVVGKFEKTREELGGNRGRTGLKRAQTDRPSPFRARFGAPFDLDAIRTIYSPLAKSHTSIHSSFAAEEQRSLRDTISERRVVLVVLVV
jgi:hypothetical protein